MTTETTPEAILRKGIQDFLDGDYENPRAHRPNKCSHGVYYFESCAVCDENHFIKVLEDAKR